MQRSSLPPGSLGPPGCGPRGRGGRPLEVAEQGASGPDVTTGGPLKSCSPDAAQALIGLAQMLEKYVPVIRTRSAHVGKKCTLAKNDVGNWNGFRIPRCAVSSM